MDIRLLPDANPDSVLATLKRVVADTAVHFSPLIVPKAPFESPTNTDFFRAVERAAHERDPGAFVTSSMLTGATDRPMYRRLGIIVYGLDPFRTNDVGRAARGARKRRTALGCELLFGDPVPVRCAALRPMMPD